MKENKTKSVAYKMSINLAWLSIDRYSRIYEIPEGSSLIIPGLKYSLITMFLGWWGFSPPRFKGTYGFGPSESFRKALKAIHTNFSGGEDVSKMVSENAFDDRTNFVWNNLLRKTCEVIGKEEVDIVLEIQDAYNKLNTDTYSVENIDFILENLDEVNINNITNTEIEDVFDALKLYNRSVEV